VAIPVQDAPMAAPAAPAGRSGGERGIRTLDTAFDRIPAFQASAFNHSAISPLYRCENGMIRQPPLSLLTSVDERD